MNRFPFLESVQAFRCGESSYESAGLKLRGLDQTGSYKVNTLGQTNTSMELSGGEIMEVGLRVEAPGAPSAVVMVYQRQ